MIKKYKKVTSSEIVSAGHVDSIADTISDAIVDSALKDDKNSRVAIETAIKNNEIILFGEISTDSLVDYDFEVLQVLKERKIPTDNINITKIISKQSKEINQGVDKDDSLGAGDQGLVFGYATNETNLFLDTEYYLSYKISKVLENLYQSDNNYLSDYKVQVGVVRDNADNFIKVDYVLVSIAHDKSINVEQVRKEVSYLIKKELKKNNYYNEDISFKINPNGAWHVAHSQADAGLTGRKIVSDTYGGQKVGGGALSGKDYTKVDRSGAYFARFLAKNLVYNKLVDKVSIELSYVIGKKEPVGFNIDILKHNKNYPDITGDDLKNVLYNNNISLSLDYMVDRLDLKNQRYKDTALNGHFTDPSFSWERLVELKKDISDYTL